MTLTFFAIFVRNLLLKIFGRSKKIKTCLQLMIWDKVGRPKQILGSSHKLIILLLIRDRVDGWKRKKDGILFFNGLA